ncbi:hypothetical protein ACRN9C_21615 [Shewanella frigidimarina]|uniref:hypothetical protein n=1 Tax=Shewanella frigidimarina TaxID=56812 RepID=UPI003D7B55F2
MKKVNHEMLSMIHEYDEVGMREISKYISRKHNDHRDFYGLTALIEAKYINFTGPIPKFKETGEVNSYVLAQTLQAYSQGEGMQQYKDVTLFGSEGDAALYLGPKGIEYFHARQELRKGWFLVALLSLVCSIASGIVVGNLSSSEQNSTIDNIEKKFSGVKNLVG